MNQREKWHRMLDEAMDRTPEGSYFLGQFVRMVLDDAVREAKKDESL